MSVMAALSEAAAARPDARPRAVAHAQSPAMLKPSTGIAMKAIAGFMLLGVLLAGPTAQAQYLTQLATTPLSQFNDADNKLFLATIDKALAEGADGVAIAWKNERTPAGGIVTPQKSYVSGGMKCRDLLIANSYKTLKGEAVHSFCQDGAGKWKLRQ
jgi:surface antigen